MGDQVKYREALHTIFYEGKEVGSVEVVGPDGKKRTVSGPKAAPDIGAPIPQSSMDALAKLRAQVASAKEKDD
jgi:hypothetical protein